MKTRSSAPVLFILHPSTFIQFHPELDRRALLERTNQYPQYVRRVLGVSPAAFASQLQETPLANELLGRFVQHVFAGPAEDA